MDKPNQSELDGLPTVEDLRVSAKTLRYFVLMLEKEECLWPWWKRLIMDYPSKHQYMKASVKFDSIADLFEQHLKQANP